MKSIALLFFSAVSAYSASVAVQSGFAYGIVDNSGNQLAVGSGYLAVGYFSTLNDFSLATSTGAQLAADFQVFGNDVSTFGANGFGGFFNHAADTGVRIDGANPFVGQNIYFVVANGPDLASSTQALIYKFGSTFVADPNEPTPPSSQVFTPDLNAANYLLGSNDGVFQLAPGANVSGGRMAVLIPEPSSLVLGGIGFLALLRRRR